jgi:hypothetical protein
MDTLIFYEFQTTCGLDKCILLDWIIIDLSASSSGGWVEVFNWGDTNNTNNGDVNPTYFPPEKDNQQINYDELYNGHGILIYLNGTYQYRYVRISAPGGCGDTAQIDAIDYLP